MRRNLIRSAGLAFGLMLIAVTHAGLDSQADTGSDILIRGEVDQTRIALNRTLDFTVTLSWDGGADVFTVLEFDDPVLSNFEITATATQNHSRLVESIVKNASRTVYTLRPKELGMAYIDSVRIKVKNHILDREEVLTTRRISVEILAPIPEAKKASAALFRIMIPLVVLAVPAFFILIRLRKRRRGSAPIEPVEPIEGRLLKQLRTEIDLDRPDLHEDFNILSMMVRNYLHEKYDLRSQQAVQDELPAALREAGLSPGGAKNLAEILIRTNEIKFSGIPGESEELVRFFTFLEDVLETSLHKGDAFFEAGSSNSGNLPEKPRKQEDL